MILTLAAKLHMTPFGNEIGGICLNICFNNQSARSGGNTIQLLTENV